MQNLLTDFSRCKWDLKLYKVQSDNGSVFKAAVTQGVSKVLGTEYHLHCFWRPQSSEKVEKANDINKRHPCKPTRKHKTVTLKFYP